MADIIKLNAKGLYSTDMRGKPMTACSSYQQILIINNQSTELFNFASLGFYNTGQLLNRAKRASSSGTPLLLWPIPCYLLKYVMWKEPLQGPHNGQTGSVLKNCDRFVYFLHFWVFAFKKKRCFDILFGVKFTNIY